MLIKRLIPALYFSSEYAETYSPVKSTFGVNTKKMKRFFKRSSFLPFFIILLFVILVIYLLVKSVSGVAGVGSASISNDPRIDLQKPKAQQTLNKQFSFPLKDQAGKEISQFSYSIQNAELRDQIIVKGQKATAVKGKTFLIFNLKITNNYDKSIQINARDFIRLSVNGSNEELAPTIHNDPEEVQAISTKYTRLGLPISDTDKNITLQVGEIDGKKSQIKLDLK